MWIMSFGPTSVQPSTCTSALGYRPASLWERVAGMIGRPEFPGSMYPVMTALCLGTVPLAQSVLVVENISVRIGCELTEPDGGEEDKRDYTFERAIRLPSVATTSFAVTAKTLRTGRKKKSQ